ncbi:GyrI-like domain-containing protein [Flavobacterium sp. SM15]|uniref:SRPBCC family protein n=1 Tax=Flavobacterium sp. SM15 TaxID=2908005 RepID=UPI001EDB5764|nr:GyrI-like domain-containing protein [Flavobacterium sp. SM15]MCG2612101.1 GyrI-like domain-containing protein [Flavobacterium sp. SM15]
MRIIKYIFLLIFLFSIALSVYIATQASEFDIQRSKVINLPQNVLYNYVDEYKNWQDWGPWAEEDKSIQYTYSEKTKGLGAAYSWKGKDGNGKMKTVKIIENDSLFQKIYFEDNEPNDIIWGFQKVANGTKVSWRMKGKMNFMMKFFSFFKGGTENMLAPMFEKGLENIDNLLVKELKTYSVEVNGLVTKTGVNYIKQSITCEIPKLSKNMAIMLRQLTKFTTENNITVTGSPFAIYDKYDQAKGNVSFSICLPIEQEIFTSEGSDTEGGKFYSYLALKTTLKGDYSHSKEAWDKAYAEIAKKHWKENPAGKYIEVYKLGTKDTPRPSKWVTEIYIPILAKVKPIEIKTVVIDSTKTIQ